LQLLLAAGMKALIVIGRKKGMQIRLVGRIAVMIKIMQGGFQVMIKRMKIVFQRLGLAAPCIDAGVKGR
jgi:hypothetical protein